MTSTNYSPRSFTSHRIDYYEIQFSPTSPEIAFFGALRLYIYSLALKSGLALV